MTIGKEQTESVAHASAYDNKDALAFFHITGNTNPSTPGTGRPNDEQPSQLLSSYQPNSLQLFCLHWCGDKCCCCTAEDMERESKEWKLVFDACHHEVSVWETGGIRYQAHGNPRRRVACPVCRQVSWATLIHKPDQYVDASEAMKR